jgi:hypothetical protein
MLKKINLVKGQIKPTGYTGVYLPTGGFVWEGDNTSILDTGYEPEGGYPPGTPHAYDYSDLTQQELNYYNALTVLVGAEIDAYNASVSIIWQVEKKG